jgi:hypothetical protein
MISSNPTAPVLVSDVLKDGEILAFPDGTNIFRIGEICGDGVFGGEICEVDYPDYAIEWVWLSTAQMAESGFRRFPFGYPGGTTAFNRQKKSGRSMADVKAFIGAVGRFTAKGVILYNEQGAQFETDLLGVRVALEDKVEAIRVSTDGKGAWAYFNNLETGEAIHFGPAIAVAECLGGYKSAWWNGVARWRERQAAARFMAHLPHRLEVLEALGAILDELPAPDPEGHTPERIRPGRVPPPPFTWAGFGKNWLRAAAPVVAIFAAAGALLYLFQ